MLFVVPFQFYLFNLTEHCCRARTWLIRPLTKKCAVRAGGCVCGMAGRQVHFSLSDQWNKNNTRKNSYRNLYPLEMSGERSPDRREYKMNLMRCLLNVRDETTSNEWELIGQWIVFVVQCMCVGFCWMWITTKTQVNGQFKVPAQPAPNGEKAKKKYESNGEKNKLSGIDWCHSSMGSKATV